MSIPTPTPTPTPTPIPTPTPMLIPTPTPTPMDVRSIVKISLEVLEALSSKRPVVALESNIITGGLPHPFNFQKIREVKAIIRRNGAVPATIAIVDGVPRIGLSDVELRRIAYIDAKKTACRDIAYFIAKKERGGTTVAATAFLANMVGIPIVVTCGISNTPSDLAELGRTSAAVVCGGAELVADTPRMLECLESQGVCAATFKTCLFPAVENKMSTYKTSRRLDSIEECGKMIETRNAFMLRTGILIAVPVPLEVKCAKEMLAFGKAMEEAQEMHLPCREEIDFVNKRVGEMKNILLLENIAIVGAKVAVSLSQQQNEGM